MENPTYFLKTLLTLVMIPFLFEAAQVGVKWDHDETCSQYGILLLLFSYETYFA